MALHAGDLLLGPQLIDQGRQERPLRLLGLAAACQPLRNLQEHLGGAMIGGDFRDHLTIIGGRAEHLRVERDRRNRRALDRLGVFGGGDLRPLRYADLIEAIQRGAIGGEAMVGADASRAAIGALEGSGALMAGFKTRVSLSFPLRLPNTIVLHAGGLLGPQLSDQG